MIPNISAKFKVSSMIRSLSRTPILISELKDIEGSWLETWRIWVILDLKIVLETGFLTCVKNFIILAWLEVCQELPCHHQWLGGHWGFLTGDMEDMGYPWPHNCSWNCYPDLCAKFQHSRMNRSVSRTCCPSWGYWKTLRVPDRRLGGQGHPWYHWSLWRTPKKIPWKVCVNIFIFGWVIIVCHVCDKNMTDTHICRHADTTQIYIIYGKCAPKEMRDILLFFPP